MTTLEQQIDCALETASKCRHEAGIIRQCGIFPEVVNWLMENAKAAERWAVKQARSNAT